MVFKQKLTCSQQQLHVVQGEPWDLMETDKSRWILHPAEPHIYFGMVGASLIRCCCWRVPQCDQQLRGGAGFGSCTKRLSRWQSECVCMLEMPNPPSLHTVDRAGMSPCA